MPGHWSCRFRSPRYLLFALLLAALTACGGSGGSGDTAVVPAPTDPQTTDSDGDGVVDAQDQCAATPAGETADVAGCSLSQRDDDNDGVLNAGDECPATPAGESVDASGCSALQATDRDDDGVPNEQDQCPGTLAGAPVDADGCAAGPTRAGDTTDVTLDSEVDGQAIAFTLHEPTAVTEGQTYPLILHSHGYGGSRQSERPAGGLLGRFLDAGYYVISIDQRGHGDSGGTIRILDPDLEGQDLLQILRWADTNLAQLLREGPDPVIGAVGGSYGGGYQLLIHAIDPNGWLDAIAPDITWNDLRYSLFSGGVFKTFWATLLSVGGNVQGGRQDPEVNGGLVNGLLFNSLNQTQLDLLYRNSPASHCAGENDTTAGGALRPIDAFITQSPLDTLFNFNDAARNYRCLRDLGGDVRLFTKSQGHGIDSGDGGENCGVLGRDEMTFRWFEEKLKLQAGAADAIPPVCLNLGPMGADGIVLDQLPEAATLATVEPQTLTLLEGSPQVVAVPLYAAPASGDVLAGIPTVSLNIASASALANPLADPIVFVALGIQPAGSSQRPTALMNQYRPFRGFGSFQDELNGVTARLAPGDSVMLLLQAAQPAQYFTSGSTTPVPVDIDATVALPLIGPDQIAPVD